MHASARLVAFLPSVDLDRARPFFHDALGLRLSEDSPFACVFDAQGTELRVTRVDRAPEAPFTVLGWTVDDIAAAIAELTGRGVTFVRFDGMDQDDLATWTAPGGARVAWFKDPDGNTLSLTQPAEEPR